MIKWRSSQGQMTSTRETTPPSALLCSQRPRVQRFVWTKARPIPQPEFKCWRWPKSSSCRPAHASGEQHWKGDKNTNHCDLLLIVYRRVEGRWTEEKEKKKNRMKSIANWIVFVWARSALGKKERKQEKKTNSLTGAIYDNGTIIYSDLSERLISHHKGGGSILTIHFWNYLHIDPGTSASKAGARWP